MPWQSHSESHGRGHMGWSPESALQVALSAADVHGSLYCQISAVPNSLHHTNSHPIYCPLDLEALVFYTHETLFPCTFLSVRLHSLRKVLNTLLLKCYRCEYVSCITEMKSIIQLSDSFRSDLENYAWQIKKNLEKDNLTETSLCRYLLDSMCNL